MCLDCGCRIPDTDHDDPAHITLNGLQAAADASGITAAQAAANIVMTLAYADDATMDEQAVKAEIAGVHVLKASDERRYALGLAYPARVAPGLGADGYNDWISEAALEKAAWEWMANRREIGLFHKDGEMFDGHGTVVESYIWRGDPWTVTSPVDGSTVTIHQGDWMLGVVFDEYAWGLVKDGIVNGWSPEGGAARRKSSPADVSQLRR